MAAHDRIALFLFTVRARIEQARGIRLFAIILLAVLLALTGWCLLWVLQGYAVPRLGYLLAVIAVPVLAFCAWMIRRTTEAKAAHMADDHFGLKDSLTSYLGFSKEHREGELYALQAAQTAERVQALDARSISLAWPRRLMAISAILLVACVVMGFRKATPFVMEKLALEAETTKKTDEINKELEVEIEELIKNASEDEKELLKPDEWRQWVKELKETKDQKEAMRQYAELERKLQEAAQKLSQREQEHLLAKAGEELKEEAELREIGRKLEEKNYRDAAADLQKMELKADVTKPDEARKELAKLKAAAQRMAAAARNFQQRTGKQGNGNKSSQSQSNNSNNNSQSGKQSEAEGQQGESSQSSMDQQMASLDEAMQQYEKSLNQKQSESQCKGGQKNANQKLGQLCQSMCKSAGQRDLMKKLMKLSQCAGQCQGYLGNKECQSLAECMKPGNKTGGKNAGWGSVESRRAETDPTQDNGNRDQLQGIKGDGPANTSIEAADSGTGTATRQVKATEREWKRQLESFIQREDVPSEVKEGVKEYFKGIQEVGVEKKAKVETKE
jgi:myosin heavy subunit